MAQKKRTASPMQELPIQTSYQTADGAKHALRMRDSIPFAELGALVCDIAAGVVDRDAGYQPYLYDYVYWGNLLGRYTDFDLSVGADQVLDAIHHSDLTQVVASHIQAGQRKALDGYTADLIEYRKNRTGFDTLCASLNVLLNEYGKKLAKAMKPRQLEQLLSRLSGMTAEDFRALGRKEPQDKAVPLEPKP